MAKYFVAYNWTKGGNGGAGCTSVTVEDGIRDFGDIKEIVRMLEDEHPDLGRVVITNWQRFERHEEDANG